MNKNSKVVWGVVIVIIIAAIAYAISRNNGSSSNSSVTSNGPVKIGFIGPLTGDGSSIGTVNKAAVELAVEEINNGGGINGQPLSVVYEDGRCNAEAANNAANKLINIDKVPVIIGGLCSSETSAFAPGAMQKKVLVLSYGSSAPALSQLGTYFFRDYPSDLFQGKYAADYAFNTLKVRKVAILYHVSEWGTGIKNVFVERFKALGGEIVGEEGQPQDAKDYRTSLSKIKNLSPDLIYMPTYPDGATAALTQAKQLGMRTQVLGGDAWDDPKLWKAVSGKGAFSFVVVSPPLADEFKAKIAAKTKSDQVPVGTPQAYDDVKMIAQIISQVGTDPDKMQAALRQIQYDGVSGHISFDEHGDVKTAAYIIKKIEKGTAVEVKQ